MLINNSKNLNSIFERIIRDKNGVLVRVRFVVVEINGKFQAQIVSAEAIQKKEQGVSGGQTLTLLARNPDNIYVIRILKVEKRRFVSLHFSLEFLMSQPTRAPSSI